MTIKEFLEASAKYPIPAEFDPLYDELEKINPGLEDAEDAILDLLIIAAAHGHTAPVGLARTWLSMGYLYGKFAESMSLSGVEGTSDRTDQSSRSSAVDQPEPVTGSKG